MVLVSNVPVKSGHKPLTELKWKARCLDLGSSFCTRLAATILAAYLPCHAGAMRFDMPTHWAPWLSFVFVLYAFAEIATRTKVPLHRYTPAFAIAMVIILCVWLGAITKTAILDDGVRYFWLNDDMMISLRYAQNLAAGDGLVWNPGDRVEGITNFLWTLFFVPCHWWLAQERIALGGMVMNAVFLCTLLPVLSRLSQRVSDDKSINVVLLFAVATSLPLIYWTVSGGESILAALLVTTLAIYSVNPKSTIRAAVGAGFVAGCCTLVRNDIGPIAGLLLLQGLVGLNPRTIFDSLRRPQPLLIIGIAVFLAFPTFQTLFRLSYYGEWLPNTYYLKVTGWDGRVSAGWRYFIDTFLVSHGLLLFTAIVFGSFVRQLRPILVAVCVQCFYVVWIGGDGLSNLRFFVPILPLIYLSAFVGLNHCFKTLAYTRKVAIIIPFVVLALSGTEARVFVGHLPDPLRKTARSELFNVAIGRVLEANTTPNAVVAHFWAGSAAYFSNRPGHDLYGKNDSHIARLPTHAGLHLAGHNKYDLDYSLDQAPDVIVAGAPHNAYLAPDIDGSDQTLFDAYRAGYFRAFAELGDNPDFKRLYLANSVAPKFEDDPALATLVRFHGIFVREGSEHAKPAPKWRSPRSE